MRATRLLPALVTAVAVTALTAGCAAPEAPVPGPGPVGAAAPSSTAAAASSPTSASSPAGTPPASTAPAGDPGPTGGPGDPEAPAVALPWPARTPAEAADLQGAVDGGAQAWLLDPEETALSYASAALGWTGATTERQAPDTVLVTGPAGARRTIVLVQPARTGPGGIWTVTADRETPIG